MPVRNRRSNSGPRARSSAAISSSVSMPGISIIFSSPFTIIFMRVDVPSGTGWPRSRNQVCISLISSRCPTRIRSQRMATSLRAPCVGAQAAMINACAWWGIIPVMKATSASL